ncbi:AMP-binding protein [Nocardia sp. NPDC050789]
MRGSDVSASGRAVSGAASTSVDRSLDYAGLAEAARALAARISDATRVALWATPTTETAVAAVAALLAGVPVIPVNPNRGTRELAHIVADSDPSEA